MKLFISTVRSSNETQSLLRLQPILKVSQQLTLEYKANVLQNVIYKFKLPKKFSSYSCKSQLNAYYSRSHLTTSYMFSQGTSLNKR